MEKQAEFSLHRALKAIIKNSDFILRLENHWRVLIILDAVGQNIKGVRLVARKLVKRQLQ